MASSTRFHPGLCAGTVLAASLWIAPALAVDAFRGGELAKQWCSSCHVVDLRETGPAADSAPAFVTLARDERKTEAYLKRFLGNPHYPMPQLDLGRSEIDDLVAYIRSLQATGKGGGKEAP